MLDATDSEIAALLAFHAKRLFDRTHDWDTNADFIDPADHIAELALKLKRRGYPRNDT